MIYYFFFFFKQKTAYEMRISDWSSDVCSSDLVDLSQRAIVVLLDERCQAGAEGGAIHGGAGHREVDESLGERGRAAQGESDEELGEPVVQFLIEFADHLEVDQRDTAVGTHEEIPRVQIRVEEPVVEDHPSTEEHTAELH